MSVAMLAHHGVPAVGHNAWLVREKLPLPSHLKYGVLSPELDWQQVDPLLVVEAYFLNNVRMGLHAVEPQHVVGREREAATHPRICSPNLETHDQEVVVVYAVSVSAPRHAAP